VTHGALAIRRAVQQQKAAAARAGDFAAHRARIESALVHRVNGVVGDAVGQLPLVAPPGI
jgi:hypothetical protein